VGTAHFLISSATVLRNWFSRWGFQGGQYQGNSEAEQSGRNADKWQKTLQPPSSGGISSDADSSTDSDTQGHDTDSQRLYLRIFEVHMRKSY